MSSSGRYAASASNALASVSAVHATPEPRAPGRATLAAGLEPRRDAPSPLLEILRQLRAAMGLPPLQAPGPQADRAAGAAGPGAAGSRGPSKGSGAALEARARTRMETALGADFSEVRVHEDDAADALGAEAFTQGTDIHFGQGRYAPNTPTGDHLLAHELTHVVQQSDGRDQSAMPRADAAGLEAGGAPFGVPVLSDPGLEAEAETNADRIAATGEPASTSARSQGAPAARALTRRASSSAQPRLRIGGLPPLDRASGDVDQTVQLLKQHLNLGVPTWDDLIYSLIYSPANFDHNDGFAFLNFLANALNGGRAVPQTAAQVGQALANRRSIVMANEIGLQSVDGYLTANGGAHIVITEEDGAAMAEYYNGLVNGLRQNRAYPVADTRYKAALGWIEQRTQIPSIHAGQVNNWCTQVLPANPQISVIVTNPQERGDMHDVRVALALKPGLKVLMVLPSVDRRGDAAEILGYYDGFPNRVALVRSDTPVTVQNVKNSVPGNLLQRGVSQSTETLLQSAMGNRGPTEQTIEDETAGALNPARCAAYDADLLARQLVPGGRYVIVNYRDSGHNVPPGRQPSHPELDTGSQGFWDMIAAVQAAGFTPVPMGSPPAPVGMAQTAVMNGPNLVDFWLLGSCQAGGANGPLNKRQCEYGLLRRLNEYTWVRALSMRSGVTDALVFSGIETISIDMATETFTPNQLNGANLNPGDGSSGSWRRATKREQIRPGRFHQGFLVEPRDDNGANPWQGPLDAPLGVGQPNTQHLTQLITQHFGSNVAPVQDRNMSLDGGGPMADPVAAAGDARRSRRAQRQGYYRGQAQQAMDNLVYGDAESRRMRDDIEREAPRIELVATQSRNRIFLDLDALGNALLGMGTAPIMQFDPAMVNQMTQVLQAPCANLRQQGGLALLAAQVTQANLVNLTQAATNDAALAPAFVQSTQLLTQAEQALAAGQPLHSDAHKLLAHVDTQLQLIAALAPAPPASHGALALALGQMRNDLGQAATRYASAARLDQRAAHLPMLREVVLALGDIRDECDRLRDDGADYRRDMRDLDPRDNPTDAEVGDILASMDGILKAIDLLGFLAHQLEKRGRVLCQVVAGTTNL